jgi:hypothetical protein
MPVIEGKLTSRRLILQIAIAPSDPNEAAPGFPVRFEQCNGLIDTGASRSAVSARLVRLLSLPTVGKRAIASARSENMHNLHMIRMGLYLPTNNSAPAYPYFLDGVFEVIDWADHPWFDVLIGMDVIGLCNLAILRTGTFKLDLP